LERVLWGIAVVEAGKKKREFKKALKKSIKKCKQVRAH